MSATCKTCSDVFWVCENHPDKPWDGYSHDPRACGCGAGMPCESCNDTSSGQKLKFPKGLVPICSVYSDGETIN